MSPQQALQAGEACHRRPEEARRTVSASVHLYLGCQKPASVHCFRADQFATVICVSVERNLRLEDMRIRVGGDGATETPEWDALRARRGRNFVPDRFIQRVTIDERKIENGELERKCFSDV
jgi:hypothetical protein